MVFQIRVAEQVIEIHSLCSAVFSISRDYVIPEDRYSIPDIIVNIIDKDILKELNELRNAYARMNLPFPIVGEGYCESLAVFRKIADSMPAYNTFLMHGAAISKDNQAFIFSADSGVGKTTRAELWLKQYPDSFIINGDKPFIKVNDSEALVCGTPWCGKEGWNRNAIVPLKAIYLLERAENEPDQIEEADFNEILPILFQQVHRPESIENTIKTIELLTSLEGKAKFYKFRSNRSMDSIRTAFEVTQKHDER